MSASTRSFGPSALESFGTKRELMSSADRRDSSANVRRLVVKLGSTTVTSESFVAICGDADLIAFVGETEFEQFGQRRIVFD